LYIIRALLGTHLHGHTLPFFLSWLFGHDLLGRSSVYIWLVFISKAISYVPLDFRHSGSGIFFGMGKEGLRTWRSAIVVGLMEQENIDG